MRLPFAENATAAQVRVARVRVVEHLRPRRRVVQLGAEELRETHPPPVRGEHELSPVPEAGFHASPTCCAGLRVPAADGLSSPPDSTSLPFASNATACTAPVWPRKITGGAAATGRGWGATSGCVGPGCSARPSVVEDRPDPRPRPRRPTGRRARPPAAAVGCAFGVVAQRRGELLHRREPVGRRLCHRLQARGFEPRVDAGAERRRRLRGLGDDLHHDLRRRRRGTGGGRRAGGRGRRRG